MVTLEHIEASALVGVWSATAAAWPTEDAAIAERVRPPTTPFSWPMRLLPPSRRKAMQALYAFGSEVGGIADRKASWTMKLALLADWRAEIAQLYAGRPEHAVTRALARGGRQVRSAL